MRGRTKRIIVGVAGTLVAVGAERISLDNGATPRAVLLDLAIGLTYVYGGLAIADRAPRNKTGAKMTATGLTWFIGSFGGSGIPVIGDLGIVFTDLYSAFLLALVLSYPGGALETTVDRIGIAVMVVGTTLLQIGAYLVDTPLVINQGSNGLYGGLALAVMASVLILRRWWLAPARARSDLLPVLFAGVVFVMIVAVNIIRRIALVPDSTAELLIALTGLAPAAIPVALLIGFYRQSERRLQALVDAIPDPLFRIGRDGDLMDARASLEDGRGSAGPADEGVADLLLAVRRDALVEAVGRALDTGRLQSLDVALDRPGGGSRALEVRLAPSGSGEVTAIVRDFSDQREAEAEVRRSRTRIVEATDAERRRVERNLHDGAQQRLVALSLALRRARSQLPDVQGAAAATLEEATSQLHAAMAELRELARGIHPAILTEAGLAPAIRALAAESPVPVILDLDLPTGLSSHVEAAAYFVVAESLTNIAKYAEARQVDVIGTLTGEELRVEVRDDGRGGADPAAGSGLRGLSDRVAALDGHLEVISPVGGGTRVVATLPLAWSGAPA